MASCVEELDTEMFIESVKAHPEIWNISSEEYKDKRKKDAAWEEISRNVVESYDEKDDRDKSEIVKKLIAKWRNIRDTFSKSEKKRTRSGQPAAKVRQYIYARQLSFLQPSIRLAASQSILGENQPITNNQSIPEEENVGSPPSETPEGRTAEEPKPNTSTPTLKPSTSPVLRKRELERSLLKYLNQPISIETPDEDRSFFDSILPSVRKLNEEQKIEFRLEVLHALKKIKQGYGSQNQRNAPEPVPASQSFAPCPFPQPSVYPALDSFKREASSRSSSIGSDRSTSMSSPPPETFPFRH